MIRQISKANACNRLDYFTFGGSVSYYYLLVIFVRILLNLWCSFQWVHFQYGPFRSSFFTSLSPHYNTFSICRKIRMVFLQVMREACLMAFPVGKGVGMGTHRVGASVGCFLALGLHNPPSAVLLSRQMSLPHLLEQKMYTQSPPCLAPQALSLMLTSQMLPFQLMESAPFCDFAVCAVIQWQVVGVNSTIMLTMFYHQVKVMILVHMTTDAWSSKRGQGWYISCTA